ncbi:zinc ribbon domain-containing protein [Sporomusa carbonis]|uniref:zinc ribbon domain-containing protein n=1 Tax=Sporomusa carbonis TaxID=3076075 RepID=UPI003C7E9D80
MWEAVQLEMERRRDFALEYGIQKLEYATTGNPFAGRVICGSCGRIFGRKVWNSTDERLRRIIWRCNGKYPAKGQKGCESKHIDDGVLYQAFVNVFNTLVENKGYFLDKWQGLLESDNALVRYKAKQFIRIFKEANRINEFDESLYFALVEKVTVYNGKRLIVSLLDGTELECEI